ncbi:hypothetical protein Bca4012_053211 [Brassica carinata]
MGGWWRCLFAGDPTVDLSVPRRSVTARGVQMRLLSGGSSASHIPLVSHGYVWGVSSLGVVARVLEVSVAARDETRDSIHVSLVVSVFRSWVLDCGSALVSLFSHNKSLSCGGVASVSLLPEEQSPVPYLERRHSLSVDSSSCCRFLLVASRFEPPFSLGARGNRGLSPLIPFPWAIDATLTHVCL